MTLEELFYLLAIVYIIAWLIFLVVITIGGLILYRRFKETKASLRDSAAAAVGMKLLSPTPLKGLIAMLPVVQFFYSRFKKRKKS